MSIPQPGASGRGPASGSAAQQAPRAHGFPSPARDYLDGGIDLNRELVRDRTSTFLMRVAGNAMAASGIRDGDELVVDRAATPRHGSVVVAVLDGELVVRRMVFDGTVPGLAVDAPPAALGSHTRSAAGPGTVILESDDGAAPVVLPAAGPEGLRVWGVATYCLHRL
ncbi:MULTISPECIES: LexA family transcriptional regulator [Micrococcaceae]|uniref:LexA family protein n=1 Tax=Micrococcaceae TaxID=1268 RepID=UPI00161E9669|nr:MULTISPECIES: S24 family peptidase [Micrococcaceae]MBB5750749.1 DNA polymerase V [Micrococcus sp. TA1]HRO31143.1 S24 family peptidase [Citricoccus sp.]HRO94638.1 S24 family peptidase [Citricoccus sp.]